MTWQMASFGLLAIALVAGFAWYERTHPSSKVLALVATLAALAVLGRMAFAPIPSVKPTTDIILLTGYVLGGAPGFAVGAVAALASNFFFGQGPYTPWQMVGWGAVGLGGAALAAVFGRELGRYALAAACGVAGLLYGLFMDVSVWVTFSGHTLGELGVLVGRGVPFNIAHAAGNVAFCVAFGPMLVRALTRFRDRFEITWHPAPVAGATLLAIVALGAASAAAPPTADAAAREVERGADYLEQARSADGGFAESSADGPSDPIYSGWAAIGLAAAGRDPGPETARYLKSEAAKVRDVGDMERTLLALRASGQTSDALVRRLAGKRRRNGSFEGLTNRSAFAILAFRGVRRRIPRQTLSWLLREQNRDGGWSLTGGGGGESGVDDTSAVVMALVAAGRRDSRATRRAVRWLERRQGADGGFPLTPGQPSNAQSTAFVVQALVAARRNPSRARRGGARSPVAYLRSLQQADGSFRYSRTSDQTPTWVTAQVVAALAKRPLPVAPVRRTRANASKSTGVRAFAALVLASLL
jgi:energy-coupling factor transport system substrate-specific component